MIHYSIQRKDGTRVALSSTALGRSFFLTEGSLTIDHELKDYVDRDGKLAGERARLASMTFTLSGTVLTETDEIYEAELNALYQLLYEMDYLVNETSNKRVKARCVHVEDSSDKGIERRVTEITADIEALEPYWESAQEQTFTINTVTDTYVSQVQPNNSVTEMFPIIEFTIPPSLPNLNLSMTVEGLPGRLWLVSHYSPPGKKIIIDCANGALADHVNWGSIPLKLFPRQSIVSIRSSYPTPILFRYREKTFR